MRHLDFPTKALLFALIGMILLAVYGCTAIEAGLEVSGEAIETSARINDAKARAAIRVPCAAPLGGVVRQYDADAQDQIMAFVRRHCVGQED